MKQTSDSHIRLLHHIVSLEKAVGSFAPKRLFELPEYYCSRNTSQMIPNVLVLQRLVRDMACFVNMPYFTIAVFPEKQEKNIGGHIEAHNSNSQDVFIAIDPDFLRYPMVTIKVLAHEISHKFLSFHHLALESTDENEILTDVTAIYLGFGTFALNGGSYTESYLKDYQTTITRTVKNGYLDLDDSAFVYDIVCRMRGFSSEMVFGQLNKNAVESIMRVRKHYAKSYPPDRLDVSPIKDKLAFIRCELESVDLALCNIDKIKMLSSNALITKTSKIESARKTIVTIRETLQQIERAVDAPIGAVTYPGIPVWKEEVRSLADSSNELLGLTRSLNDFVSRRVTPDVTRDNWDMLTNVITECPKCDCKLRLPVGKTHMVVTCPHCKYSFDYSTICPVFKWIPPPSFKEKRNSRFKSFFMKIRKWVTRSSKG